MHAPTTPQHIDRRRRLARWLISAGAPVAFIIAFIFQAFAWGSSAQSPVAGRQDAIAAPPALVAERFPFGRVYRGENWQLYFNEPDATVARADYKEGLDAALAAAIANAQYSLDIAAFELNSDVIADAIRDAHERGLAVRIVTDNKHGLGDKRDPQLRQLREAGIAVIDDGRGALMHNKFLIIDEGAVWTGSWNYTVNGSYRNNNNAFVLESAHAAAAYRQEFDEMFERGEFGPSSADDGIATFAFGDGSISILFAPEGDEISAIAAEIARAERSIRFMIFAFSLDELAQAMLKRAADPAVTLAGIFEERNSKASWSQMPALHCAGASVRQDGNRYLLHHKVIIVDDDTVITGSFNFSRGATKSNDENILIIRDATVAAAYLDEWRRIWDGAEELAPGEVVCD